METKPDLLAERNWAKVGGEVWDEIAPLHSVRRASF